MTLHFKNAFHGTVLSCQYRRGDATFRSENLSTLAIIKEFITKSATERKVRNATHHPSPRGSYLRSSRSCALRWCQR